MVSFIILGVIFPLLMILFGLFLSKTPPTDINYVVGYRTKRSMASKEAWLFANVTAGKYWVKTGLCSLPIFVIIGVVISIIYNSFNIDESNLHYIFLGFMLIQVIVLLSVIPYTERKLKRKF